MNNSYGNIIYENAENLQKMQKITKRLTYNFFTKGKLY